MEIDTKKLRDMSRSIKEFGLGFIQVKITSIQYLNFYTDKVSKFVNAESPHNHQNHFNSTILCGKLTEQMYDVSINECGESAFCGCGDVDKIITEKYVYTKADQNVYHKGDKYFRHRTEFHSVEAENNTVTHILKISDLDIYDAIVIGEKSEVPPSKYSEEGLWNIVDEIIKECQLKLFKDQ